MAKFILQNEQLSGRYETSEIALEIRPWGTTGTHRQMFVIGSGANFDASGTLWLEISYTANGRQIFYTRNFLQHSFEYRSLKDTRKHLQNFAQGKSDSFGFGDTLPETHLILKRTRYNRTPDDGEADAGYYTLHIGIDTGVVFEPGASPGGHMINLEFDYIELEDGLQFMHTLIDELVDAAHGKHPDPALTPPGASEWAFGRQLNEQAYDRISLDYQEGYLGNPLLKTVFNAWLAQIPSGGHVLDAGCGHGDPIIHHLLEKGFRVTGTDLSTGMLKRAREQFPDVPFLHQSISELTCEAEFDAACSFSSLLYLDPIDLAHSIHRLYHALKPGGLLFLYAFDLHPTWQGVPYDRQINQWMWSWNYSSKEAAKMLQEHGYFKVLKTKNVTTPAQKQHLIDQWREETRKEYDKMIQLFPASATLPPPPDTTTPPDNLAHCYAIIAQR